MGTSSSFRGAGNETPLLPTWADPPEVTTPQSDTESQPDNQTSSPETAAPALPVRPAIIPDLHGSRFRKSRLNFTRFVSSGGTNRKALGQALKGHVGSVSGGSRNAARRMSSSKRAVSNLLGILHDIRETGLGATLEKLKLSHVSGRSLKDVLIALTDVVCGSGGPIDEGIARSAYLDTIAEVMESGEDLETLSDEQIDFIILDSIVRSLEGRIINDIGQSLDTSTITPEQADKITSSLRDFLFGAVRDRLGQELEKVRNITKSQFAKFVDKIYEVAFSLIEAEANSLA